LRTSKKDVTFQGFACKVGKLDPLSALRIIALLQSAQLAAFKKFARSNGGEQSKVSSPPTETQVAEMIAMGWALASAELPEEQLIGVQQKCLITCEAKSAKSQMFERVMTDDGRWVQDEVADNLQLVNFLVVETLKYNLTSFFLEGASEPAKPAPQGSAPSAPPR
jgi:hypothetical protein